jgi:hypothetical protein
MNSSVYSADRATYLRIVTVAPLASMAIVGFAISARISDDRSAPAMPVGPRLEGRGAEPGRRRRAAIAPQRDPPDLIRLAVLMSCGGTGGVDADQRARGGWRLAYLSTRGDPCRCLRTRSCPGRLSR